MKENLVELNYKEVLEKVSILPIYEYNFKSTAPDILCRGPIAQDWHKLFPSEKDPLKIDTMDLDGISFAAIKGLIEENRYLKRELKGLIANNRYFKRELIKIKEEIDRLK